MCYGHERFYKYARMWKKITRNTCSTISKHCGTNMVSYMFFEVVVLSSVINASPQYYKPIPIILHRKRHISKCYKYNTNKLCLRILNGKPWKWRGFGKSIGCNINIKLPLVRNPYGTGIEHYIVLTCIIGSNVRWTVVYGY